MDNTCTKNNDQNEECEDVGSFSCCNGCLSWFGWGESPNDKSQLISNDHGIKKFSLSLETVQEEVGNVEVLSEGTLEDRIEEFADLKKSVDKANPIKLEGSDFTEISLDDDVEETKDDSSKVLESQEQVSLSSTKLEKVQNIIEPKKESESCSKIVEAEKESVIDSEIVENESKTVVVEDDSKTVVVEDESKTVVVEDESKSVVVEDDPKSVVVLEKNWESKIESSDSKIDEIVKHKVEKEEKAVSMEETKARKPTIEEKRQHEKLQTIYKDEDECEIDEKGRWLEIKDAKSGRMYYYNELTKRSVWDKPKGFDLQNIEQAKIEKRLGEVEWIEAVDKLGRIYYYDKRTLKSRWDRPATLALPLAANELKKERLNIKTEGEEEEEEKEEEPSGKKSNRAPTSPKNIFSVAGQSAISFAQGTKTKTFKRVEGLCAGGMPVQRKVNVYKKNDVK